MSDSAISPRPPGTTPQNVETPPEFLEAVFRLFGKITIDFAASRSNVVGEDGLYFGQIHKDDPGSLELPWAEIQKSISEEFLMELDWAWINPPFSKSKEFIKKCAEEAENGANILCLVQTATSSRYWLDHVFPDPNCSIIFLTGRIKFVGYGSGANIDTSLIVWSKGWTMLHEKVYTWDWKKENSVLKEVR